MRHTKIKFAAGILTAVLASMCMAAGPIDLKGGNWVPNVEVKPGAAIDFGALAGQYEAARRQVKETGSADNRIPGGLFLFVSLSMPKPSLEKIVVQAEKVGATIVLRGLIDKSLVKTAEAIKAVIGDHKVSWQIDPRTFKMFGIDAVPATVMVEPGASMEGCTDKACNSAPSYSKVVGDVSLMYALSEIESRGAPALASMAGVYRQRLEASADDQRSRR